MKNPVRIAIALSAPALLLACSDDAEAPEADEVTETRMDEVDVIDGTISDDMVDVDAQPAADADSEEGEEDGDAEAGSDDDTESSEE